MCAHREVWGLLSQLILMGKVTPGDLKAAGGLLGLAESLCGAGVGGEDESVNEAGLREVLWRSAPQEASGVLGGHSGQGQGR